MASCTLERCSLHGWILIFTVQGRWQTACMASCGWAVCWCQRCGSSGPWWRWGYGTVTRSWGLLLCHSSMTITSCCSMIIHGPMLQRSVHNSWKQKTSQFLHGQHTRWTCHPLSMFGMLWIDVYDSVFQFLPISSNFAQPLKRSGPTFQRPQSPTWSTLCEEDVLHCIRQMVVCTPNTVKLHILEWYFIVASLRHTCAIIMLSNQHLDMPHLWGGWITFNSRKNLIQG